jgi:uncharacterized peroxidase-related enzyme
MSYIQTISEDDAEGAVAEMYAADRGGGDGPVPNYAKAFCTRPGVYARWKALNVEIKVGMDLRRYELATVAAARRLRSTYCTVAHGSVLLSNDFLDAEELGAVVADHRSAGLSDVDVAVMDLADKVAADATSVTQDDVDRLRALGLTDADVVDVVLAAAARAFFSKTLDALGARADVKYAALEPELLQTLTVGRPIAEA